VDRASYDLTTDPGRIPDYAAWPDERLPELVDLRDSRQVLHVTFGSVITALGPRIRVSLLAHAHEHEQALASHFRRHLEPFTTTSGTG
jgi:hypothetical protein